MKNKVGHNIFIQVSECIFILFPFLMIAGRSVPDFGVIVVVSLFLVHLIINRDFAIFKEPWLRCALLLWLYLLIRSIFASDVKHALAKSVPAIRFILFAAAFAYIKPYTNEKFKKRLLVSFLIVLSFVVVDVFIQFFTGLDLFGRPLPFDVNGYRLTGPFAKKMVGGAMAFLAVLSVPSLIPSFCEGLKKYFFATALLLIYVAIAFSGERAALLAISTSTFVIATTLFFKRSSKRSLRLLLIILCAILCALVIIGFTIYLFNPIIIQRQFFSIIEVIKNPNNSHHLYLWFKGLDAGFSNILFGIGPNHFEAFCNMSRLSDKEFICSYHPHNVYIEFFAEGGLIALGLFLLLLFMLARQLFTALLLCKDISSTALLLGAFMAAFQRMLPIVPSSGIFKAYYAIPIWFAIGWMLYLSRNFLADKR